MSASSCAGLRSLSSSNCCQDAARAHRALETLAAQICQQREEHFVIGQQILRVAGQAVTDSGGLGRLQMRPADADVVGFGGGPLRQRNQQRPQLLAQQAQRFPQAQDIGVVLDIHAGCAQMQDAAADCALLCETAQLGHQVVMQRRFQFVRALDVDGFRVRAQVSDLFCAYEAGALLCLRQFHPDAAPQSALVRFGPDAAQPLAAIAPTEGAEVALVREIHR